MTDIYLNSHDCHVLLYTIGKYTGLFIKGNIKPTIGWGKNTRTKKNDVCWSYKNMMHAWAITNNGPCHIAPRNVYSEKFSLK